MSSGIYDLVIIGAGPAGLTAGIYAPRMGMKALIPERDLPGGRAFRLRSSRISLVFQLAS